LKCLVYNVYLVMCYRTATDIWSTSELEGSPVFPPCPARYGSLRCAEVVMIHGKALCKHRSMVNIDVLVYDLVGHLVSLVSSATVHGMHARRVNLTSRCALHHRELFTALPTHFCPES